MDKNEFNFTIKILRDLGHTFFLLKKFDESIIAYKWMLELAWEKNDYSNELEIYKKLAVANYYLGDLKRANYYEKRATWGMIENDLSVQRWTSVKRIQKMKFKRLNHDAEMIKDDDPDKLPSPWMCSVIKNGFCKQVNVLPHYYLG